MRPNIIRTVSIGLFLFLVACAGPRNLPAGPTPIPFLVPATLPASPLDATPEPAFIIQSYPAQLPSAENGMSLYQVHCASCHGDDGNGVVPGARNFGDLDYMRGETPADFYAAITEGRGEMPGFQATMSSDERWDVVAYIWRFSTNPETLTLGKQIYDTSCGACHGEDGVGEVLGASDFTDLRLVDNVPPRDFYLIVTQGKGSMPAWQGRLSQDERWAVIDYVRTFSYDPTLPDDIASAPQPTASGGETPGTGPPGGETGCDSTQSNPFSWDDEAAISAGGAIYDESCAICHGADGSGGLPNTIDFTSSEANEDLVANSGEGYCIVADGKGAMPGWKEIFTVEQMWQTITYLASLGSP